MVLPSVSVVAVANGSEANGGPALFRFSRTGSTTATLSVGYRLLGTAQADKDYTGASTSTIIFLAGSATAELLLPALADAFIDPGETILARIEPSTANTYLITPGLQSAIATITAEHVVVIVNRATVPGSSQGEVRNNHAFAALKSDGTVACWGNSSYGGMAPSGLSGVTQIFSTSYGFAALKTDGTVVSWGKSSPDGAAMAAPPGLSGVSQIFSTNTAFAALKGDGSVVCWGDSSAGGTTPPGLTGVTWIFSNATAFAALKSDGTVVTWGNSSNGGATPSGLSSVSQIISNPFAFAALKSDGTVVSWGDSTYGGTAPSGLSGVTQIFSNYFAFAALKSDGTVFCWGESSAGGTSPTGLTDVTQIFSTYSAFAALKSDGSVVSWGLSSAGGFTAIATPPGLSGVTQIFSNASAFAALRSDGTVVCWGDSSSGGTAPGNLTGVTQVFATFSAFAALKSDGTVVCWGAKDAGGTTPSGLSGVTQIFSTLYAFTALKNDGTVVSWGDPSNGGTAPQGLSGVVGLANPFADDRLLRSTISLAVSPASVTEDGLANLVYTFTRTSPTTSALTVNYIVGGTATLGSDYAGISTATTTKSVTFEAGQATATVTVDPIVDTSIEANETVELTLVAGTGYIVGTTAAVIGTIANDDFPSITLAVSAASVAEDGASNLVYTFTRTGPTTSDLTVYYNVAGSASLGSDYVGISPTGSPKSVAFEAGKASATVTVDPTGDSAIEPDETVELTLAAGMGYTLGTATPVLGTIANDDFPVVTLLIATARVSEDGSSNLVYTFSRTGPTTSALTVNYAVAGTALLGIDYLGIPPAGTPKSVTFEAGKAIASLTVDPTADATVETDETVELSLAAGTGYSIGTTTPVVGTITNDDFPSVTLAVSPASVTEDGAGNLVYTFTRTGPVTSGLAVNYTVAGSADLGLDYTGIASAETNKSIAFAVGAATATVVVDPTQDSTFEFNETVSLMLSTGAGYTVSSSDPVTGTICNDDGVVVSVSSVANGNEANAGPAVFRFARTGTTAAPLSVRYRLFGTAQSGKDYTGSTTGTITILAGSATANLTLPALADPLIDPGKTMIARIEPSSTLSYFIAPGQQSATATITAEGMAVMVHRPTLPNTSKGEVRNSSAFAALKSDGTVVCWGAPNAGSTVPLGLNGVTQIYSSTDAFAALKNDGTVVSWGDSRYGGTAPTGLSGVTQIFSTGYAFAALKGDGSVVCWGFPDWGGTAPSGLSGVIEIFSNSRAFAALRSDGTVVSWGDSFAGGLVPSGLSGVTQIFATDTAFAALKSDGTIVSWGDRASGGRAPAGLSCITQVASNSYAFAALASDSSVFSWGDSSLVGTPLQGLSGVSQIFSNSYAFAALKSDGTVVCWGSSSWGGTAPTGLSAVIQIFATKSAFAALKSDGTVVCWGNSSTGGTAPVGLSGVTQIFSTDFAFAALKSDGTVVSWGKSGSAGAAIAAPVGLSDVSQIFTTGSAFAALKSDGTVVSWGDSTAGGTAPVGLAGVVGFADPFTDDRLVLPTIRFSVSPERVDEDGGRDLVFTFSRSGAISSALTVNYQVSGSATLGTDYTGIDQSDFVHTLRFGPGNATATLAVKPTKDAICEADETVVLGLLPGSGYVVGTADAVVGTILNDDLPAVTLTLAKPAVAEDGANNLDFVFSRSGPTASGLTVNYQVGGSATLASDYTGIASTPELKTILFAPGFATATLSVDPIADSIIEVDETVALTLAPGSGYILGTKDAIVGTILNDDFPRVSLAVSPASVSEDGTANLIYTFTRSGPTTSALTVGYTVSGTAILGTDYTGIATSGSSKTVAFAAGSSTATVVVDPTPDAAIEFNETVALTLLPGAAYTVATDAAVTGTILNDDGVQVSVTAIANGSEATGSATQFRFSRTGSTATALAVNYQLFGTAQAGKDYTGAISGTVTFAAGSATAILSLPVMADAVIDPGDTIIARIKPSLTGSYFVMPGQQSATATITAESMAVTVNEVSRPGFSKGEVRNSSAFAALKSDGTVVCWGDTKSGGIAPAGLMGVTQIFSTLSAFAALKSDGTVVCWGDSNFGGTTPAGLSGVSQIFSNSYAFAALKSDGTVTSWGFSLYGGTPPLGLSGVTQIVSNSTAFTALKSDGTVVSWGGSDNGGTAPQGLGDVSQIVPNFSAFAALKRDGTVVCWGNSFNGGTSPRGLSGVSQIASTSNAFAALMSDSMVVSWGDSTRGGLAPADLSGVARIFSNDYAFAALKSDGTVACWGYAPAGGTAPSGLAGVIEIVSAAQAFAALKSDGSVVSWGSSANGGTGPSGLSGVTQIVSSSTAFAALRNDGTVVCWGSTGLGGGAINAPANLSGVTRIHANGSAFAALKDDGTVVSWGDSSSGGTAPAGLSGVVAFADPSTDDRLMIPAISLSVSRPSVFEDGVYNLVYTFTRTGATTNALTVNYGLAGTAIPGNDYLGVAGNPGSRTITFQAGASTASITIDPSADSTSEPDETVALTLLPGTGYMVATPSAVVGTILNDDIVASVSTVLTGNQSSLLLQGSAAMDGTGNALNNSLVGNGASNRLDGKYGADVLTGLGGADTFLFSIQPDFGVAYADHITDFSSADGDKLQISRSAFGLAPNSVASLTSVNTDMALMTALGSKALFAYDQRNGNLYWNQNGTGVGFGTGGIFAILDNKAPLSLGAISLVV